MKPKPKQLRARTRAWTIFRLRGAYALFHDPRITELNPTQADIIRAAINELIVEFGAKAEEDMRPR